MSFNQQPNIVVIGGGTGSYTVLSGLKKYPVHLTAIVTMADDGGSTGRLRDEFGVLPPGDVRQCLVALAEGDEVLRKLFSHRFDKGELAGHSAGNLFISALEQITGSLDTALDLAGNILKTKGQVIPVTLEKVKLIVELCNGKILYGEHDVSAYQLVSRFGIKRMYLAPKARVNPKALVALKKADLIVIGPGNLYSSLLPNFLVSGVKTAVIRSPAKKIFIANLMNKHGHTDGFSVFDYVREIEAHLAAGVIETIIYNTKRPSLRLIRKNADEGEPVDCVPLKQFRGRTVTGLNLLADNLAVTAKVDMLRRTLIRHDPERLARAIISTLRSPSRGG